MDNRLVRLSPRDNIPYTPTENFDFSDFEYDPIDLSNHMQTMVHDLGLIAVSAPQIQIRKRVIYIRGFESAMFNPKIVDFSEGTSVMEEVTGSIPDMVIKIKRPETIRVRWTNAFGDTNTHVYSGLTARSIQRKIDYLDGVKLISRANQYHRDKALKGFELNA